VNLQVGDVLEYHILTRITVPLAPHEFWYEHSFLKDVAIHEEKLEIDIPGTRAVKPKSPDRKYETKEAGKRRIYTWVIQDVMPDRTSDRETEPQEPDFALDVQISSFSD
jgi:hypothetical protein